MVEKKTAFQMDVLKLLPFWKDHEYKNDEKEDEDAQEIPHHLKIPDQTNQELLQLTNKWSTSSLHSLQSTQKASESDGRICL